MRHTGIAMVLFSYLLVGISARGASPLDRVLAPLVDEPLAARADASAVAALAADEEPATPARPLVERGADELDLLAELERQLAARLQTSGELRLIPVSPLPHLRPGAGLPAIELVDFPARISSSSVLLRFRLIDGERPSSLHVATFRAQLVTAVWTPVRRLTPGEAFGAADVTVREVDLVREPKAVPADAAVFGRYEIARSVAPERPLTWNDLVPRALVRKGHVVEVVAQEGLLAVSMKGQATRSGALGEVITIRNLESKREFSAEVVDENKVRVHF